MTNRSKSPRKRRLQLNAEEFAPPSHLAHAPDEQRLDETWVQYYGGQKQGGIKRLSSIDEDASVDENDSTQATVPPQPIANTDFSHLLAGPQSLPPSFPLPQAPATPAQNSLKAEHTKRPRKRLSPVKDFPKYEQPQAEEDTSALSFESWFKRWALWLKRGGSIKVCEAFFQLTHAQGSEECFTSNSEIMKITDLSRAQCIRNIHYLIEIGFLEVLNGINNREGKGTYYRFNLTPNSMVTPLD